MPLIDVEQQTPGWLALRRGRVTGSEVWRVMKKKERGDYKCGVCKVSFGVPAKTKRELQVLHCPNGHPNSSVLIEREDSAEVTNYRRELVRERLTKLTVGGYVSPEMEWGIEQQPYAQEAYERHMDCIVEPVGIAIHDRIRGFASSPDGLVGEEGVLEIKCLITDNHLEIYDKKEIPEQYQWQMLAEMACTGRQFADFVSFDPRVPFHMQLVVLRVSIDEQRVQEMEAAVEKFLGEVEAKVTGFGCPEANEFEPLEVA